MLLQAQIGDLTRTLLRLDFTVRRLPSPETMGSTFTRHIHERLDDLNRQLVDFDQALAYLHLEKLRGVVSVALDELGRNPRDIERIRDLVLRVIKRFWDDANGCLFLYVDPDCAKHFGQEPEEFLEVSLPLGLRDACADDLREALQCFALGNSTACVFHLCRALEAVLINIIYPSVGHAPLENQAQPTWGIYLRAIKKVIERENKDSTRTTWDNERVKDYEQIHSDYGKVKDAERAKISHTGVMFTDVRAAALLLHTKNLLHDAAQLFDDQGQYKRQVP